MKDHTTDHERMTELELLIALRLGETEFTHRFGMSPADAQIAARAVRDVMTDLVAERRDARADFDNWVARVKDSRPTPALSQEAM